MFVYGRIQGVGVTAYRICNNLHIEAEEVGPNVTNNRKRTIVTTSVKYISGGKRLFPSGNEISNCSTFHVL